MKKATLIFFLFTVFNLFLQAKECQVVSIQEAVPVWVEGREKEMNLNLGFRANFQAKKGQKVKLKIAASTLYRLFLNGEFIGSGPARAAHGYFRIDEYELENRLVKGKNTIAIEVAGYNINSYYTLDQPSFLLAEVTVNGKVAIATGSGDDFETFLLKERLQKVERYSFQRPFTEYYRMQKDYDRWRTASNVPVEKLKLAVFPMPKLLSRNVSMPEFKVLNPVEIYAKGILQKRTPDSYYKDRSLTRISPVFKGYTEQELEIPPVSQEIQEIATVSQHILQVPFSSEKSLSLKSSEFYTADFGTNLSGFIGIKVKCNAPSRLLLHFDELLTNSDVAGFLRMRDVCNAVVYELDPGEYCLETLESYTLKYLKIMLTEGDCKIEEVYLREFAYPENKNASFVCSNPKLNKIYAAAAQSSRQNRMDVFMDCPSRERAGWLCDSYYAGIMEKELTGYSTVAYNFLENYALPETFEYLPEGMIPMCYPADHNDGNFIPNWSLWFIIQLEDYARRNGNSKLITQLKPRVEKLLEYFSGFENEDGLLEKLKGWIFVEWSAANNFTQDVNYPSNMLYCAALNCAAKIYGNTNYAEKSERIRRAIVQQSYNGSFFIDNAVRKDGNLTLTDNSSEVCQYYAFFFDIVNPDSHPELWRKLATEFGPLRNRNVTYPKVFPANAFMGNYMRMDLLSRYGLQSQMLSEIQDYFYSMAIQTGTLWEHMQSSASCNHGFASYIGHVLYRDVLGISNIDYLKKEVSVRFSDSELESCRGAIPVEDEVITLKWNRSGDTIFYSLQTPADYRVKIENRSSAKIETYREPRLF
jgi:alpha-L-rhamnosidase